MEEMNVGKLQCENYRKILCRSHDSSFNIVRLDSTSSSSTCYEFHISASTENLHLHMWNKRTRSYWHELKCCYTSYLCDWRSWRRNENLQKKVVLPLHMQDLTWRASGLLSKGQVSSWLPSTRVEARQVGRLQPVVDISRHNQVDNCDVVPLTRNKSMWRHSTWSRYPLSHLIFKKEMLNHERLLRAIPLVHGLWVPVLEQR